MHGEELACLLRDDRRVKHSNLRTNITRRILDVNVPEENWIPPFKQPRPGLPHRVWLALVRRVETPPPVSAEHGVMCSKHVPGGLRVYIFSRGIWYDYCTYIRAGAHAFLHFHPARRFEQYQTKLGLVVD